MLYKEHPCVVEQVTVTYSIVSLWDILMGKINSFIKVKLLTIILAIWA
jgi:hypothetical protein